jgi:hypothetical protein
LPDDVVPKSQRVGAEAKTRETIANLQSDLAYLRRQQHELRSRFHGELAVLALRIEDNERRSMKRRKAARWWSVAAVVAAWLWFSRDAVFHMLDGPVLFPGLLVVTMTLVAGVTVVLLILHNEADEQEHRDRHQNWFRLTERD